MQKAITTDSRGVFREKADMDFVIKLFARLGASYGRLFTKQHDDDAALDMALVVWAEQVHGLSDEDVERGINSLPVDYPPNPFQFRALCLQKPPVPMADQLAIAMIERDEVQQARDRMKSSQIAKREMKKIRRAQRLAGARSYG